MEISVKNIPKDQERFYEEVGTVSKDFVDFFNDKDVKPEIAGASLAFAVLFFLKAIEQQDEEVAKDFRNTIFEVISEGR